MTKASSLSSNSTSGRNETNATSTKDEETPLITSTDVRTAYGRLDTEASRRAHDLRNAAAGEDNRASSALLGDKGSVGTMITGAEAHQTEGGMLKPIIFGGLDGILTAFAIVAGAAGGNLSPEVVLILGFSNIFADALAMGVGEFLSSKATNEWILAERRREEWEFENYPEGEIREMIDIFETKGMSRDDATIVIQTMAKYKGFFVDIMMAHELELQVPEENHLSVSFKEGVVMFLAFATFGAMPLVGYVIFPLLLPTMQPQELFGSACLVTGVVLFFMGSVKSFFSAQHWFTSGLETLLLGGTCATVAYTIGQLLKEFVGTSGE